MKTRLKIIMLLLSVFLVIFSFEINTYAASAEIQTEESSSSEETETGDTTSDELSEPNILKKILLLLSPDNWLELLTSAILKKLCELTGNFINALSSTLNVDFFKTAYVREFLDFFYFLAWIILAVGFIKGLVTELEHSSHGEASLLQDITKNFMIASGVVFFARYGVLWVNQMTLKLINDLTNVTLGSVWDSASILPLGGLLSSDALWVLVIMIVIVIISIITLWSAFKRCGILLLQIVTGYFYSFDLASGNSGVLGEWIRDVVSGCITFSFQIILYQIGMKYIAEGLLAINSLGEIYNSSLITGLIFLSTAGSVPTIMRRWGYASQHGSGRLTQTASLALSATRFLV